MTRREKIELLLLWLFLTTLAVAMTWNFAYSHDNGQWAQSDPEISKWYRSLMEPNAGPYARSCCGEGDGYYADNTITRNGHVYAQITDDRDDKVLQRPHIDSGTLIEIPASKMLQKKDNPTGHDIIFVQKTYMNGDPSYTVYCFILGSGI